MSGRKLGVVIEEKKACSWFELWAAARWEYRMLTSKSPTCLDHDFHSSDKDWARCRCNALNLQLLASEH